LIRGNIRDEKRIKLIKNERDDMSLSYETEYEDEALSGFHGKTRENRDEKERNRDQAVYLYYYSLEPSCRKQKRII